MCSEIIRTVNILFFVILPPTTENYGEGGLVMRDASTDNYAVAWSALADIIARGEKERALGVFRLLTCSFDDTALALQLEGDILWAFNDNRAPSKYASAARLYYEQGKKRQAIAVYEHIILLAPHNTEYLATLIDWYGQMNVTEKQIEKRVARLRSGLM